MEYLKTEIKTGATVLVCLALLILLTIGISGTKTLGRTYTTTVLFKNVGGMDKDAPVNFSGFEVGNVKDIRLTTPKERKLYPKYNIAVHIKINANTVIKEDSIVQIRTLGYLGLKYIDITAGTPESKEVERGEVILGFTPQDVNDIIDMIGKTLEHIKPKLINIINGMENVIGDNGTLTLAIDELRNLIKDADDVIVLNRDDVRALISNLTKASDSLKVFAKNIEENPWKLLIKSKPKKKGVKIEPRKRKTIWRRRK